MVKKIVAYRIENNEGVTTVSLSCADGEKITGKVEDMYNLSLLFNLKNLYLIRKNGCNVLKTVGGITPNIRLTEEVK